MKHRVHLYVTTRIAFDDIEAGSHDGAIDIALKKFFSDPERLTRTGEYAEEVTSAVVDEENDHDYQNTTEHEFTPIGRKIT